MMIKVFDYIDELDAFVVRPEFSNIVRRLGVSEWSDVVWIGRYFARDQDFGEHWFDNWEEREALEDQAKKLGYDYEELLIVVPERFAASDPICPHCEHGEVKEFKTFPCPYCRRKVHVGADGPWHPAELRKRFWTDVLKSFHISLDTIFEQARWEARLNEEHHPVSIDVEQIIKEIRDDYRS